MTDGHQRRPESTATPAVRRTVLAVRVVLSRPASALLALAMAFVGLTLFVIGRNHTVAALALTGQLPAGVRLAVIARLYPFVGTAYGTLDGGLLATVAALFGVAVAMLTHARSRRADGTWGRDGAAAAIGIVFAAAAAFGPVLLAGLRSVLGVAGAGPVLPLAGREFGLVAGVALVVSIHRLSKHIPAGTAGPVPTDAPDR